MALKITPIIPKPLHVEAMRLELVQAMRDIGEDIRDNFEDTTRTWRRKPSFQPSVLVPKVGTDKISVETETDDRIYTIVSDGAKSHPIFPRNAKKLRFPGTFVPKTFPGVIGSSSGFSGGEMQTRDWVAHPGVEARKFDEKIRQKIESNLKPRLDQAAKLVRKASNHAL